MYNIFIYNAYVIFLNVIFVCICHGFLKKIMYFAVTKQASIAT